MKTTSRDYYKTLGVPEKANETEIKKAFRRLALEHHPDHNRNDPRAEEKFKEISEAYGVLMDPKKRREYDLFRSSIFTGGQDRSSEFRYSRQDIFEDMFRHASARDIFKDLNKEFQRSGFRSGTSFFETILFGGAAGKLGRIMGMIPGPIGRLGQVLRLAQWVGSSMFALNRMHKARKESDPGAGTGNKDPSLADTFQNLFSPSTPQEAGSLNMNLKIAIPPGEALNGVQKKISYKVGEEQERLVVSIPPGTSPGSKLRIKDKGYRKNDQRGDLILTVDLTPS